MRRVGLPILALAGFFCAPAQAQTHVDRLIAECDRVAAGTFDVERPRSVPGVPTSALDARSAMTACSSAVKAAPNVRRLWFQLGRAYAVARQYEQAREAYQAAQARGHVLAPVGLAILLQWGLGGPRDLQLARQLYEKAAIAGVPVAMRSLAVMLESGAGGPRDPVQARRWFEAAAREFEKVAATGSPEALFLLAEMVEAGQGVAKDSARARRLLEDAARRGHPEASKHLQAAGVPVPAATQEARTEVLKISTRTLTDQQFLTGAKVGVAVTISGELRIPKSSDKRLPAIVLLHGSGGIARNVRDWSNVFNALGIATFAPDSFTGRGLRSVASSQAVLGRLVQVFDAYRALEVLAKHPRIDPTRIALMGWSRGGVGPLYASLRRLQKTHGPPDAAFAAYIPFYAPCNIRMRGEEDVADRPIRIFHGAEDDLVPVAPCRAYVERLRKAGKDIQLTAYAGARHLFDDADFNPPRFVAQIQTSRHCRLEEAADGAIVNSETHRPFGYQDSCADRGSTIGYDEAAYKASIQAVTQFLRTTFKLR
jgi:dienelactone hydrolase